jgi:hypothetical protein
MTLSDTRLTSQKSETVSTEENFALAANTIIQKGQMIGKDANGNVVPANNAACVIVLGAAQFGVDNSTPPSGSYTNNSGLTGAAGQGSCNARYGVNCWNNDSGAGAVGVGNVPCTVYAKDDQTVSLSDGAGAYLPAGVAVGVGDEKGGGNLQVHVQQGPVGVLLAKALGLAPTVTEPDMVHRARAVVTTSQTYTTTDGVLTVTATNSAMTFDGVTVAVGDVVLFPTDKVATAADAGPYVITQLAATGKSQIMARPGWYESGSTQYTGQLIEIGGEGTVWAGSSWKSLDAAKTIVVDTTDAAFFPRLQTSVESAAMTAGVLGTPITALYVSGHAVVMAEFKAKGGTVGGLQVSTQTAGPPGTSSLVATSESTSDTSTVRFKVTNF